MDGARNIAFLVCASFPLRFRQSQRAEPWPGHWHSPFALVTERRGSLAVLMGSDQRGNAPSNGASHSQHNQCRVRLTCLSGRTARIWRRVIGTRLRSRHKTAQFAIGCNFRFLSRLKINSLHALRFRSRRSNRRGIAHRTWVEPSADLSTSAAAAVFVSVVRTNLPSSMVVLEACVSKRKAILPLPRKARGALEAFDRKVISVSGPIIGGSAIRHLEIGATPDPNYGTPITVFVAFCPPLD